jgi:hypothetical protein
MSEVKGTRKQAGGVLGGGMAHNDMAHNDMTAYAPHRRP